MTDTHDIEKAVEILSNGGLVAFPTETVYGLGADARNPDAVGRVFKAKERPADHPLIVHLESSKEMHNWAKNVPPVAERLAEAFWPGPLTLILEKQPHVLDEVTAGQQTVGLRVPNHPVAHALLKAFGSGLVAPSANKFTHISPTSAEAVRAELGDDVDLILDGGACDVGIESAIVDLTGDTIRVLRPGMLSIPEIEKVVGQKIECDTAQSEVKAPGQHHVHYAPTTTTFVYPTSYMNRALEKFEDKNVAFLTRELFAVPEHHHIVVMSNNVEEYAANLYRVLRACDQIGLDFIFIEDVPDEPEWLAVKDRINKAAGSRGP